MSSSLVQSVCLRTACYLPDCSCDCKWRVGVPCLHCNSTGMNDEQERSSGVSGWFWRFDGAAWPAILGHYHHRLLIGLGQFLHADQFIFWVNCCLNAVISYQRHVTDVREMWRWFWSIFLEQGLREKTKRENRKQCFRLLGSFPYHFFHFPSGGPLHFFFCISPKFNIYSTTNTYFCNCTGYVKNKFPCGVSSWSAAFWYWQAGFRWLVVGNLARFGVIC